MLPVMRPGGGTSPRQASAVIDLPLPDSPTSPNTSPLAVDRVQPRTACTVRSRPGNSTRRSLTSSRSAVTASVARLMLGIERVADAIADQVDGEHRDEDRKSRETDGPPIVDEARARQGGHQPPFRSRRLGADADEAERGRGQDGITEVHGALHDDRREGVRQGVPQYDADIP